MRFLGDHLGNFILKFHFLHFGMNFSIADHAFEGKIHSKQHVFAIWNDFFVCRTSFRRDNSFQTACFWDLEWFFRFQNQFSKEKVIPNNMFLRFGMIFLLQLLILRSPFYPGVDEINISLYLYGIEQIGQYGYYSDIDERHPEITLKEPSRYEAKSMTMAVTTRYLIR